MVIFSDNLELVLNTFIEQAMPRSSENTKPISKKAVNKIIFETKTNNVTID